MSERDLTGADLDLLFEGARRAPPIPPGDLTARVLAGAEAMRPSAAGRRSAAAGHRIWAELWRGLGGWPGAAGLATAAAAGVWIGASASGVLGAATADYLGTATEPVYVVDTVADLGFGLDGGAL